MNLYEQHIGRSVKPCEAVDERDFYCNLYLSKETLLWRTRVEEQTKRNQRPKQLTLFPSA